MEEDNKVSFRDVGYKSAGYPNAAVQEKVIYMGLEFSFMFWSIGNNLGAFCSSRLGCEFNYILWTKYRISVFQGLDLGIRTRTPLFSTQLQDFLGTFLNLSVDYFCHL